MAHLVSSRSHVQVIVQVSCFRGRLGGRLFPRPLLQPALAACRRRAQRLCSSIGPCISFLLCIAVSSACGFSRIFQILICTPWRLLILLLLLGTLQTCSAADMPSEAESRDRQPVTVRLCSLKNCSILPKVLTLELRCGMLMKKRAREVQGSKLA